MILSHPTMGSMWKKKNRKKNMEKGMQKMWYDGETRQKNKS